MIKTTYAVFLGIMLAVFVGVGIAAFYTQPTMPEYPVEAQYIGKEPSEQALAAEKQYQLEEKAWDEKMKPYNRNVSIIALVAALVFVSIGLIFDKKIKVLADGAMLGGIFTLIYSLGRGFAAQDSKYSFVVVSISLALVMFLGYIKFIKEDHFHLKPTKAEKEKT